jgi:hypothetical protein
MDEAIGIAFVGIDTQPTQAGHRLWFEQLPKFLFRGFIPSACTIENSYWRYHVHRPPCTFSVSADDEPNAEMKLSNMYGERQKQSCLFLRRP